MFSAVTSAGFRNYATDRLGSITATTGPTGDLATTYRYQPFGGLLSETGTGRNPYGFTGTYLDDATDLYQMGARYYQAVGRFTQPDPEARMWLPGWRERSGRERSNRTQTKSQPLASLQCA